MRITRPSETPQLQTNGPVVLEGEDNIRVGRMLALKGALRLELVGMKRHGRSVYAIVKEEFNLKGSKKKVYEQFVALCRAEFVKKGMPEADIPRSLSAIDAVAEAVIKPKRFHELDPMEHIDRIAEDARVLAKVPTGQPLYIEQSWHGQWSGEYRVGDYSGSGRYRFIGYGPQRKGRK